MTSPRSFLQMKIKIIFIYFLLVAIVFSSCKKDGNSKSNQQSDNGNKQSMAPGFGLVPTESTIYQNIPIASLPPSSGATLPSSFFLDIPTVPFNQGDQGSCASCASAMAKSIVDHIQLSAPYPDNGIIYSPSYLYDQAMTYPGACLLGSEIYKNLDILKNEGICKLSDMPYSDAVCSLLPNSNQNSLAMIHKIDHYFRITPIDRNTIKQFINAGLPVIVGFQCDLPHWKNSPPFYFNSTNINEVWKTFGTPMGSSHATVLYGWDDSKNAFRMLNQWGKDFGDNGSIWVDYNLVETASVFSEAYIIQNPAITSSNALQITGSLDFGNVPINTTVTKTIIVTNKGTSVINVSSVSVASPFSSSWTGGTIQPGSSQNISISFTPTSIGLVNDLLSINSDAVTTTNTINASGTGIQQNNQNRIISLSGSLSFGNVLVGQSSSGTLTVSNTGNSPLSVSSISTPAGFSGSYSGSIAAGNSVNIPIYFSPSNAQTYGGSITVNSNATSGVGTINVTGVGIQQINPTRIISLSGGLSFGNVTVGQTFSATLTISNIGNSPLSVASISTPLGFSANYNGSIQPGSSVNVPVYFSPTSVQAYGGTIFVNTDATSGTNSINVNGNGTTTSIPTAIPQVGSYGNCAPIELNPNCNIYTDGIITARVVSINEFTHELVFEFRKCDGTPFNAGGTFNITDGLCSGSSYNFGSFQGGYSSFQVIVIDNNMSGVKVYYPFIAQQGNIFYDAPYIVITY